jgi:solute carrier family 25 phosphate transporter 23/24/25/41
MTVLKIAPFSAIEFYAYEVYKQKLFPGKEKHQLTYFEKIIAGGLTGITAQSITYPFDIIKTYMTINLEAEAKNRPTVMQVAKELIARDGIRGLYKGLLISNSGIAPFIGFKMASFDWMQSLTIGDGDSRKKIPQSKLVYYNLFNGAMSGSIALTLTYPLDLTRRLIQLNGTPGHNYTGIVDACQQLWAKEGFGGFWKGLWPTYLKVIPMTAILFLTNE